MWGRRWLIVLLPILCSLAGTASKVMHAYLQLHDTFSNVQNAETYASLATWTIAYLSLCLSTTMLSTVLIIFRILTVCRTMHGGTGLRSYKGALEILVESFLLSSTIKLVYITLVVRDSTGGEYVDILSGVAKGIAPTLIVGRVASGHARPDDSWSVSIASSLRFGGHPANQSHGSSTDEEVGGSYLDDYEHRNRTSSEVPGGQNEPSEGSVAADGSTTEN